MSKKLVCQSIIVLTVLAAIGAMSARPALVAHADAIDGRSCFQVFHGYPQTDGSDPDPDFSLLPVAVGGANSTSYQVEYRLYASASESWGAWLSPQTESPMLSNGFGPYLYLYETDLHDIFTYQLVEWWVTMMDHHGTRDNGYGVSALNGQQALVSEPLAQAVGDDQNCAEVRLGATIVYEGEQE